MQCRGEARAGRYTAASAQGTTRVGRLRRSLGYVRRLRAFLALGDFELHRIAFLQAFVSLRGDGAVVNKYIWSIRAPNEPVSFRVIEPLYGSFQTFHLPPTFRTSVMGGPKDVPAVEYPR